ncbi:UNVERIFIED_CONTAM: hypothetical protein FKN15_034522 [Acipenser sinensis]
MLKTAEAQKEKHFREMITMGACWTPIVAKEVIAGACWMPTVMGDNWSGPRVSNVIYLGDILHVEASVAVDNHVPLRLYVDSCIATLSNNKDSEPRYAIVDKLGGEYDHVCSPSMELHCGVAQSPNAEAAGVVHVVRDHAVVLSKESLYHPLELVEEVQDSGSSVPVLAVSAVGLALLCCPVGCVPEEALPV